MAATDTTAPVIQWDGRIYEWEHYQAWMQVKSATVSELGAMVVRCTEVLLSHRPGMKLEDQGPRVSADLYGNVIVRIRGKWADTGV